MNKEKYTIQTRKISSQFPRKYKKYACKHIYSKLSQNTLLQTIGPLTDNNNRRIFN